MTEATAIELVIMSGPDDGTTLSLTAPRQGDAYIIGRKEDCDVVLQYDSQVSRQHASLHYKDGIWYVLDLSSRNGTYVGKPQMDTLVALEPGKRLRLSRTWRR